MTDDLSQNQTTTETAPQPVIPPTEQPPVETPPAQPTSENPVVSETPNIPNPPNSPNPEPVAPATPEPQTQQPEQTPVAPPKTPSPVSSPVLDIPALHYPFSGNFVVTFSFGQQSNNEDIKKKFQEWGIVGHNGLDFGLTAGNEVYACDGGKVIQSGDNGDFGTSITVQHSWGQSIYAHLQETNPQPIEPEPTINIELEKPNEQPEQPQISQNPQVPQVNGEEIQKQVEEKLKTELDARRLKANQARQTKREENLMKIEKLIEEKKQINNNDVCDLLHVSQSTATNYLEDLVKRGMIKTEGKAKATVYHF